MFSAFHTQVILGIFFVGGKGKADYTVAQCVLVCVYVTLQVYVCRGVNAGVHTPVHIHILQSSDTASHADRYGSQWLRAL